MMIGPVTMVDLKARYVFLKSYVPVMSDPLLSATSREIEQVRDQIIRLHRSITLSSIVTSSADYGSNLPAAFHLPTFVLRPKEVAPPKVSPQLLQQTAHLYAFIHANLPAFLTGLLTLEGRPDFNYLVASAIPSLFGYFSSREHIRLAFPFYLQIFQATTAPIGFRILYPFLTSPFFFRYFESALMPFFDRMSRDPGIQKVKRIKALSEVYAQELAGQFIQNVYLIPKRVHLLFSLMKSRWGMKDSIELLMNGLFKPLSESFLIASGKEPLRSFVSAVFEEMSKGMCESIIIALSSGRTSFRLPSLFRVFGQNFITFFGCISDISALAKVIELNRKLPLSLKHFAFDETPMNVMFWFRIFPKAKSHPPVKPAALIFPRETIPFTQNPVCERLFLELKNRTDNPFEFIQDHLSDPELHDYVLAKCVLRLIDSANAFEELITSRMWLKSLKDWLRVAEEQTRILVTPIAQIAVSMAKRRNYPSIDVALARASRLFKSRLVKQDQFLTLVQLSFPDMAERRDVEAVVQLWKGFIARKARESEQVDLQNGAANAVFWEAVEGFHDVDKDALSQSYRAISKSLAFLKELFRKYRVDLIQRAIVMSESQLILKAYVLVNQLAMRNSTFQETCTDMEMLAWVTFEAGLLKLVTEDSKLAVKFFELQRVMAFGSVDGHALTAGSQ
jgi:hypothetical protein